MGMKATHPLNYCLSNDSVPFMIVVYEDCEEVVVGEGFFRDFSPSIIAELFYLLVS